MAGRADEHDRASAAASGESALSRAGARGLLIGRYVVISTLGAGAMGVVFAAFDPELDRKVALKLLKHRTGDLGDARRRLQREAQSLAKLDHPNVVSVFDVGVHEGQLFVAMEFVAGQTLGAWMAAVETPRPWREVVEVFMAAGRGLAAAHEVGLVHRDFKPDNVMIGADGRVRVMDFGLARGHEGVDEQRGESLHEMRAPVGKLTQTGAMMGTPAYMSPEQFEGAEIDARADQFGFCVALYEALYGERPFAGETMIELLKTLDGERIRPAPPGARVPGWLREVVVRGLAKHPAARFESMQVLLERLADDPVAKRRQWAARVGLGAALVGGVWGLGVLWTQNAGHKALVAQQQTQLEQANEQLRAEQAQVTAELAAQKGLRASALAHSPGNELAALRLVLGVALTDDADELASMPAPVFTGLVDAVTSIAAGLPSRGHKDKVVAVAYAPDGSLMATASIDADVRLWDASSGALAQIIDGHTGPAHAVVFSPDGTRLATASADMTARIWDVATGEQLARLAHPGPLFGVAFAPDGGRIATAGSDASVRIWQLADAQQQLVLRHDGPVRAVAFSPGGAQLASVSHDGTARIWDANDGTALTTFAGHAGSKVHAVAWSPDGAHVVSGGEDGAARMWEAASGTQRAMFEHGEAVRALAFSADGKWLASGTFDDDAAHVWQLEPVGPMRSLQHAGPVVGVAWSPSGEQLATASWDTTVKSWDIHASAAVRVLGGHRQGVYAVAVSADGARMATGSGDDTARLWDAASGMVIAELRGHAHDLSAVAFSPDGAMLATASWDASARLWDGRDGRFMRVLDGHAGRVNAVAFSPDASRVATASADATVRIWDATQGRELLSLPHASAVIDVQFVGEDRLLALTSVGTAKLWASTGEPLSFAHDGPVTAAASSADGTLLALATKGNSVQLWDAQANVELLRFDGHAGPVTALSFSADARLLASASTDGSARVWNLSEARDGGDTRERASFNHGGRVYDLAFTGDAAAVLTAAGDHGARVWSLAPAPYVAWACAMLDARAVHDDVTARGCASVSHRGEARLEVMAQPSVIDGRGPTFETIVEHGVELVRVPAGTFMMGSPAGEGEADEYPQHEVTLDSFYLARTELTNAQYALYLDANPGVAKPQGWNNERDNQPQQPVSGLSWYDAQAYCEWAGFVLPTEAQWEYAARAQTKTAYWFGDEREELSRFGWYRDNAGERSHAVAATGMNAFGLYDMAGNLFEWTLDVRGDYLTRPRAGDGLRHPPIGDALRIVRGGGWGFDEAAARAPNRYWLAPSFPFAVLGLRPARAVRAQDRSTQRVDAPTAARANDRPLWQLRPPEGRRAKDQLSWKRSRPSGRCPLGPVLGSFDARGRTRVATARAHA